MLIPSFGKWYEQIYCRLLEITYFRAKSEKWLNLAWRCYKTEYYCTMNKRIGDVIALFSQILILWRWRRRRSNKAACHMWKINPFSWFNHIIVYIYLYIYTHTPYCVAIQFKSENNDFALPFIQFRLWINSAQ